jgi:hypothetical protein
VRGGPGRAEPATILRYELEPPINLVELANVLMRLFLITVAAGAVKF